MTTPVYPRYHPELKSFMDWLTDGAGDKDSLRFWQALLAWVQEVYTIPEEWEVGAVLIGDSPGQDTYYWEWEGPNPIGPRRQT